jgi:hypothetical protein
MSLTPADSTRPGPVASPRRPLSQGDVFQGLRAGSAPLVRLIVVVLLAVLATTLARLTTAGLGFDTQQLVDVLILSVGLAVGWALYAISCVRVLRRVGAWQRAGASSRAAAALWALGIGALIVVVPLILAALWPQHPAPILP